MKKTFGEYRYIAGSARVRGSVWEGADHLLYIETKGYPAACLESYRRIDYARVQAITYGRTSTWAWNLAWQILVTLACGFMVAQFWLKKEQWPAFFTGELGGSAVLLLPVVLLALIINGFRGPTCVCHIQTAVQSLRLKPVCRVRDAKKLASRIAAACQQHQGGGTVTQEQLLSIPAFDPGPFALQMKRPFIRTPALIWGFVLLLAGGCLAIAEPYVDSLPFFIADVIINLSGGTLLVVTRMRNARVMMAGILGSTLKAVTRNFVFGLLLSAGLYIYASITISQEMVSRGRAVQIDDEVTLSLLRWLSHASFDEIHVWAAVVMVVGGINVFLALLGLPFAFRPTPVAVPPPVPTNPPAANELQPPSLP